MFALIPGKTKCQRIDVEPARQVQMILCEVEIFRPDIDARVQS